jgi:hypothetical protein
LFISCAFSLRFQGLQNDPVAKGIIPRLVEAIFQGIEEAEVGIEFTVKLSYVEIYNERVRDLLTVRNANSDNLKIREGQHGGVYIEGVTETYVNSVDQVLQIIQQGQDNRAIASTNMNEHSSRSHSVFQLVLGQLDQNTGSKKGAKLTLVDLAGSEKVGKTGAAGQTLDEAKHINKSLSALGNVINALTSAGAHIPYRDSKLTRLLSDSLGGNSKTCLIITGSPMSSNIEETLSTLRFGTRAKFIKNKPTINQEKSVAEYKILLHQAHTKIGIQENIIAALEKDVENLWLCLSEIPDEHLKRPRPELLSRSDNIEAAVAKARSEASQAPAGGGAGGGEIPPPSASAPPPATIGGAGAPPSAAASGASAAPPVVAPVPLITTSLPTFVPRRDEDASPSTASSRSTSPDTSPENSPRQAHRRAVAQSAPPPVTNQPSPPVVTVKLGLPSLASLNIQPSPTGASGAAAVPAAAPNGSTPSSSASSANPAASPGGRKLSASMATPPHAHSLAELMLSNSELSQKLDALTDEKLSLQDTVDDLKRELEELKETTEKDKKLFDSQLSEAQLARKVAEEKSQAANEMFSEFETLKSKVEYMKKEQALIQAQAEAAKSDLGDEINRLTQKLHSQEAKMQAQAKAYEAVLDKAAADHAAVSAGADAAARDAQEQAQSGSATAAYSTAAGISAPSTPHLSASATAVVSNDPMLKKLRPRLSSTAGGAGENLQPPAPQQQGLITPTKNPGDTSAIFKTPSPAVPGSGVSFTTFTSPSALALSAGAQAVDSRRDASPEPSYTPEQRSVIDQLTRGLQRKCDQYMKLQELHSDQNDRLEKLDQALTEAHKKLNEQREQAAKKIKGLEEKLEQTEKLCSKLMESSRFFKQERAQKASPMGSAGKIIMPLHGGGGAGSKGATSSSSGSSKLGLTGYGSSGASSLPASSPAGSAAASAVNGQQAALQTPSPHQPQSTASRLSGSFARLQSAFTGKQHRDSMSQFF